jgi:stage II sporulation protein GA (sporulation sigma-E factor processing peptidase)
MDALLLWLTAKVIKLTYQKWRLWVASSIGAAYVVMVCMPFFTLSYSLLGKCIVGLLMVCIAFGYHGFHSFLKNFGTFIMMNFFVAGGIWAIHYVKSSSREHPDVLWSAPAQEPISTDTIPEAIIVMSCACGLVIAISIFLKNIHQRDRLHSFIAEVVIEMDSFQVMCKGLIDTGNQLYDPFTKTPVMIAQASLWETHIPTLWMQQIVNGQVDKWLFSEKEIPFMWQDRLRMIPYRGVNHDTRIMLALKADRVMVSHQGQFYETKKVLIALDGGVLSSTGDYEVIIHPDLISSV